MSEPALDSLSTVATDTVVMKFGGTSVGDPEKLRRVAERLVSAHERGDRVVGVLSAMGDSTDDLVALALQVSARPKPRALDMLISVGERISGALAEMAIHDLGHEAISLTGSQAGIVTDTFHGKAKIVDVRARRVNEALDEGKIVLVAGFQGVSTTYDITTLGRGGSDTTAVALAAALGAKACEIYTDVEGVFTADPRVVPSARKLDVVSYDEMVELAASGARVLQLRSVEFARNNSVKLHVRSTFCEADGTWIVEEDERMLERPIVAGVAHTADETLYRAEGVRPAELFSALAEASVSIDTVVQTGPEIVFSVPASDRLEVAAILERLGARWSTRDDLGKVSVVGTGINGDAGIAAATLTALADEGIEAHVVTTSPMKIACHVAREDVERAVRVVHDALELGTRVEESAHA
ncbi:MAG: aspartate kinase [Actinomycetota bacterium]|nr:aspartate kinase [Actinomycetota bacterium]